MDVLENASEESAAYLFAFIAFLLGLALDYWSGPENAQIVFWVALLFVVYGLLFHLTLRLKAVWESIAGKLIISALVFAGTAFSMLLARLAVNSALQVTSSPFIYTQSLVSLLVAPLVIAAILALSGFIVLPILMPFLFSDGSKFSLKALLLFWKVDGSSVPAFHGLMRFFGVIALIGVCLSFLGNNGWYTKQIEQFSQWFAFHFETEQYTHCTTKDGQRVAYINKSMIIVAEKIEDGYKFFPTNCETSSSK